jgi:Ca-activated chloride channel family protein
MADTERINGAVILRREWRELARFVIEGFAAGLVVSLVFALAVFIVTTTPAHAATAGHSGALYLRDEAGAKVETPLVFTDVRMSISGMVARVTVEQRFINPTGEWREGVYVFPLPEKAAVDHLRMKIGERVVEGMIKERGEAKRTYEAARNEGRKTTLVEQERPNMFTTSVANIGPNEEISVALEYQETLRYDEGTFRLRFPLAITPRYVPGDAIASLGEGSGWSPATQTVIDADRVTPPVVARAEGYVLPVRIAIDLNAGFPVSSIASAYHPMKIEAQPGHRFHLTLADGPVPASRDFELTWTPDVGTAPGAALFTETKGGKTYALLMALPPAQAKSSTERSPREITYIIDTSGSMEGVSMAQARDSLLMALDRLKEGDRFNVIEFNSITRSLFAAPVPFDAATLSRAKQFVSGLRARGGTEMLPALEIALAGAREASILRQVVFLTDGAVGNEDQILKLVSERIGDRRLFTVGIGPAPNMFFMTKAAQFGRGTYTAIGDVREVQEKMTALFRKLESPALTDIAVDWPAGADVWPRIVPDLYAGEPVIVAAQFTTNALGGNIALSGRRAGAMWGKLLPAATSAQEPGVGVLWARAKIDALMDAGRKGAPEEDIRAAVLDVALTHHLVSKFTSLVAVDVTPTRAAGIAASKTAVPGNIPEGLTGFDHLPRTATPAPLLMLAGALALLLATVLGLRMRTAPAAAIAMVAVFGLAVATVDDAQAQTRKGKPAPNYLLLPGHYDGDVGSLDAPLKDMPDSGWFVLVKDAAGSYLHRIPDAAGERPAFLRELERANTENSVTLQSALGQLYYVNLPRAALRAGPVVEVPLRRRALVPVNAHSYALALGTTQFSLTVNNGYKGRGGAHYVIEQGGNKFEYVLDGFGWDSEVQYAGDIDRDGLPDLVVYVNGNSAGTYYVLLSSEAKPGMNVPAAKLTASGC